MKKFFVFGLALVGAFVILNSCADSSIENKLADETKFVNAENPDEVDVNGEVDCDAIARKLKNTREGSDEYKRLMAIWKKSCGEKEDEIDCDELKRKIANTREGSDEHKRLMTMYKKHCLEKEDDEEIDCDVLARKLRAADPNTEEYKRLRAIYAKHCLNEEDDEINCDEIARKLRSTRQGTDEYKRLMSIYRKHCLEKEDDDEGKGKRIYQKVNAKESPTRRGSNVVKRGIKKD
jgi:hypothetical protein